MLKRLGEGNRWGNLADMGSHKSPPDLFPFLIGSTPYVLYLKLTWGPEVPLWDTSSLPSFHPTSIMLPFFSFTSARPSYSSSLSSPPYRLSLGCSPYSSCTPRTELPSNRNFGTGPMRYVDISIEPTLTLGKIVLTDFFHLYSRPYSKFVENYFTIWFQWIKYVLYNRTIPFWCLWHFSCTHCIQP